MKAMKFVEFYFVVLICLSFSFPLCAQDINNKSDESDAQESTLDNGPDEKNAAIQIVTASGMRLAPLSELGIVQIKFQSTGDSTDEWIITKNSEGGYSMTWPGKETHDAIKTVYPNGNVRYSFEELDFDNGNVATYSVSYDHEERSWSAHYILMFRSGTGNRDYDRFLSQENWELEITSGGPGPI